MPPQSLSLAGAEYCSQWESLNPLSLNRDSHLIHVSLRTAWCFIRSAVFKMKRPSLESGAQWLFTLILLVAIEAQVLWGWMKFGGYVSYALRSEVFCWSLIGGNKAGCLVWYRVPCIRQEERRRRRRVRVQVKEEPRSGMVLNTEWCSFS